MSEELTTSRLRGIAIDWPTCDLSNISGCVGVQVGSYGRCWSHLTPDELQAELRSLSPGDDLDVRGTDLGEDLLNDILRALRDQETGRLELGQSLFDGAKLGGCSQFSGAKFSRVSVFCDVMFSDGAQFDFAEFESNARFDGAKFGGRATFWSTSFKHHAIFDGAKFTESAEFIGARFGAAAASFNGTDFGAGTNFNGVSFDDDVLFDDTKFGGDVSFFGTNFGGNAWFGVTEFEGDAEFGRAHLAAGLQVGESVIRGHLRLTGTRVSGDTRVAVAAQRVDCEGTTFEGRVWFSLRGGEVWLTDSAFEGPVTLESPLGQIESAATGRAVAGSFSRAILRSLRGTDAEHLTLVDVDLSRCVLSGLRRPELVRLDGRCAFARTPDGWYWRWGWVPWRWVGREALFEEHVWRVSVGAPGWAVPGGSAEDVISPARLAVLYRQLRRAVEGAGNAPGASGLYYGEMEMRRLGAVRRDERWLLWAYCLVSGYGLRARRALGWLAVLVVLAAVALGHGGFAGATPGFFSCVLYALGSVVSLDVLIRHVPVVLTEWGDVVRLLLRVGGAGLARPSGACDSPAG